MTRSLGPSSYGQYGYAGALATVVVPIADVGLTSWIVREVARSREQTERNMRRLLTLKTAMTLLVLVGVTGFGALVNIGLNLWAVRTYGINGAATVTVATEAAVLVVLVAAAIRQGIVRRPRLPLAGLSLGLAALSAIAVLGRSRPVVLTAVLALAAYLVVVRLTGVITDGDVATVRRVLRRGG